METICPYCSAEIEINHDDGYGYEENVIYEQECWDCEKTFTFATSIQYYYVTGKAPCLNGGEHSLIDIIGYPAANFHGMKRCEYCDEEFNTKPEERKIKLNEYFKELDNARLD